MQLTKLGRRVLAHLPTWAEDEAKHIEMEGGPRHFDEELGRMVGSIRSYNLADFTARLAEDPHTTVAPDGEPRPLTADECETALEALVGAGLAETEDGPAGEKCYRMTQAGHELLNAPEDAADQTAGAVLLELAAAVAKSDTEG